MNAKPQSHKSEIRNPKSEANPKFECAVIFKTRLFPRFQTFHFRIWNLFRISSFGFRIYVVLLILVCACAARAASGLEENFLHPPSSARPWVYWFWLNGNIT